MAGLGVVMQGLSWLGVAWQCAARQGFNKVWLIFQG